MSDRKDYLSRALHTAARRYCDRQYCHWTELYAELDRAGRNRDGADYTRKALEIFPRYNVLNAIRVEVERLDPSELGDLDDTLDLLMAAGSTAEDVFTRNPIGEVDAAAMLSERESFNSYLCSLDADQLRLVEPLPYRRVLGVDEGRAIWARISERWSIEGGCWFPLALSTDSNIAAFQVGFFEEVVGAKRIHRLLQIRGVSQVWELREYGPEYTMDIELLDPAYNGAEGYWASEQMDWIIYASHESSVTIGGWMLAKIKQQFPTWRDHIWESPFSK